MVAAAALLALQATVPPPADFHQVVHYTMEARLDEDRETLEGAGVLYYENNSGEALDTLYFHLYLNAFRPNSAWARTEQREDFDFQSLDADAAGFHRMLRFAVDGTAIPPVFPVSPDSTVVAYPLPRALQPDEALTAEFAWEARPSTLCRRQCRRGRSYDFAHWYPRIAVYDATGWAVRPLLPQGEMYGEFATYDVTLDVADDQVIGATGVAVAGDPGWVLAAGSPDSVIHYRRDFYGDPDRAGDPGLLGGPVAEGRKRVIWRAEDVHHFAWSTSPDYRYESGTVGNADVAIHVLFRPGDLDWDVGAVVNRTSRAIGWLEDLVGPYPWPQITNLHRIEGGGTEFPMVLMDGSDGQGLIIHEAAHQYFHGIFGNNEWREGWLDEGMASFLSAWFAEDHGAPDPWSGLMIGLGQPLADGLPAPISTASAEFADYREYSLMTYSVPQAVLYSLRRMLGDDVFRDGLRELYRRRALQHVTEADLRAALERAAGEDLGWFFDQWFHSTGVLDYAVGEVSQAEIGNEWRTQVAVRRAGELWMPVEVRIGEATVRLEGSGTTQLADVATARRPERVVIDPAVTMLDVDRANNVADIPAP